MTIKYVIDVKWDPEQGKYQGELTVGLPAEGFVLEDTFRSPKKIMGYQLHSMWGNLGADKGYRWSSENVGANSSSIELLRSARLRAEEIINEVKNVVGENKEGFSHEQRVEEEIEI